MHTRYRTFGLTIGLTGLLFPAAVVVAGAAVALRVEDSRSSPQAGKTPPLAVPLVVPEGGITYTAHDPTTKVTRPDGLRVAQLPAAPLEMRTVETFLPTQTQADSGKVFFAVLGHVRYRGQNRELQVTTFQPSAAAARHSLLLGNSTLRLADGTTAWFPAEPVASGPNRLAFVRDGLIVAVAGNLPLDQLLALAATVVAE